MLARMQLDDSSTTLLYTMSSTRPAKIPHRCPEHLAALRLAKIPHRCPEHLAALRLTVECSCRLLRLLY
jgi:hypothetical protein